MTSIVFQNTEKPIVMPECSTVLPWKSITEIKGNNNYSKMIYIIKSAAGNIQKRNSIRSTWGSIYKLVCLKLFLYQCTEYNFYF